MAAIKFLGSWKFCERFVDILQPITLRLLELLPLAGLHRAGEVATRGRRAARAGTRPPTPATPASSVGSCVRAARRALLRQPWFPRGGSRRIARAQAEERSAGDAGHGRAARPRPRCCGITPRRASHSPTSRDGGPGLLVPDVRGLQVLQKTLRLACVTHTPGTRLMVARIQPQGLPAPRDARLEHCACLRVLSAEWKLDLCSKYAPQRCRQRPERVHDDGQDDDRGGRHLRLVWLLRDPAGGSLQEALRNGRKGQGRREIQVHLLHDGGRARCAPFPSSAGDPDALFLLALFFLALFLLALSFLALSFLALSFLGPIQLVTELVAVLPGLGFRV